MTRRLGRRGRYTALSTNFEAACCVETRPDVLAVLALSPSVPVRVGSVGRVLVGQEVRLVGDDGHDVPVGDSGEVWVRGPNVFRGYWNDAESTARVLVDGWLRTGDIATADDDGYLYLVDRAKDLIIVSGFNVFPAEVEEVLVTHPAVADVQVIGIPCSKYGEELVAWIKFHPGHSATEDELRAWARERIAHFKVPRFFRFVDAFPMTVTGKIQKFRMREISIEELTPPKDDKVAAIR